MGPRPKLTLVALLASGQHHGLRRGAVAGQRGRHRVGVGVQAGDGVGAVGAGRRGEAARIGRDQHAGVRTAEYRDFAGNAGGAADFRRRQEQRGILQQLRCVGLVGQRREIEREADDLRAGRVRRVVVDQQAGAVGVVRGAQHDVGVGGGHEGILVAVAGVGDRQRACDREGRRHDRMRGHARRGPPAGRRCPSSRSSRGRRRS